MSRDWKRSARGTLPKASLGARGIEHFARNPGCDRLCLFTVLGVNPASAVSAIYGETVREGQSTFALRRGNFFESLMTENGAARLLELYRGANRLSDSECKVRHLGDEIPVTPTRADADIERRLTETDRVLRLKSRRDPSSPNVVVKPLLRIDLDGTECVVEPDFMVAADVDRSYRIGELKAYPDRGGKTDPADVRSACRQAAVNVVGLRGTLVRLGIRRVAGPPMADLVFTKPGRLIPTLTEMRIAGEMDSIERGLRSAAAAGSRLLPILGRDSIDSSDVLDRVPFNYRASCRDHCAMASVCRRHARAAGDPAVIGLPAREKLAPAGTVSRAIDLLNGATPRTEQERALAEQLRATAAALREARGA